MAKTAGRVRGRGASCGPKFGEGGVERKVVFEDVGGEY